MKIRCMGCGKEVSTEVPDMTIIRAWVECPECIEKQDEPTDRDTRISYEIGQVLYAMQHCIGDVEPMEILDVAHNYAAMENHFGKNVMVHRKGATRARAGDTCIIPGSQGTASYICRGLGNPESFMSCSHGAGRRMSRKAARAQLSVEAEAEAMNRLGIVHSVRSENDLDEAPGAYKDISTVMANQADLVEIVTELKPMAVIKE